MILIRAIVCVLWSFVFLFVGGIILALVASMGDGDKQEREQRTKELGEKSAGLLCLGSVGLAAVLGFLGILPGTRKRKAPSAATDAADATAPADAKGIPSSIRSGLGRTAAAQESFVSNHEFTLAGFFDRWGRIATGAIVFLGLGIYLMVARLPGAGPQVAYVGMGLAAFALGFLGYLGYRFLAVSNVRLDDTGITWSGALGTRHQDWDAIVAVYRNELIENRQFRTRTLKLEFADGSSAMFDQAVSNFSDLAESVQTTTAELILPVKQTELRAQGQADFGSVAVKPDGVAMKGEFFPWTGLGRHAIENGHLVLYALPRRRSGGDASVRLSEIPNYAVLLELIARRGGTA
jgi:uncharacterized protein DUF6585